MANIAMEQEFEKKVHRDADYQLAMETVKVV